jgi:hypothetical protein
MAATILPFVGDNDLPMPSKSQALSRMVLRTLFGLVDLRRIRAVRAYVLGGLLACEQVDAVLAASGLMVLGQYPAVRVAVEQVLVSCGLSAYAGLIPLHLHRLGLERHVGDQSHR